MFILTHANIVLTSLQLSHEVSFRANYTPFPKHPLSAPEVEGLCIKMKHKNSMRTLCNCLNFKALSIKQTRQSKTNLTTFLYNITQKFHTLLTGTSFSFNILFTSEWFVPFVNKHTSTLSECSECGKRLNMEKRRRLSTDLGEVCEIQPQHCISSAVTLRTQPAIWLAESSDISGKFWNTGTFMKALNESDDRRLVQENQGTDFCLFRKILSLFMLQR